MSCVLLVMTDGRDDLLERTIESAMENLKGPITRRVIHTDYQTEHIIELQNRYPDFEVVGGERLGFGGAINRAWKYLADAPELYVFHLEDDFTFNKPIPINGMMQVLTYQPHLAQMALRRQPWNDAEKKAGGIVELWPDEYEDQEWEGYRWLEHKLHWTTNPSLFRSDRCQNGWPVMDKSEAAYSKLVFTDPTSRSGYWGARDSGEWVCHIGESRVGKGY